MPEYREIIDRKITAAAIYRERVAGDPELTQDAKMKRIQDAEAKAHGDARQWGERWLKDRQREAEKAEAALLDAEREADAGIDRDRRASEANRAQGLVADWDWPQLAPELDKVMRLGNAADLAAWADQIPALDRRFPYNAGGPASDARSGWGAYRAKIQQALAESRPAEVVEAEKAASAAFTALNEARAALGLYDKQAEMRGQTPIFKEVLSPRGKSRIVETGDGGFYIEGMNIWP